MKKKLPDIYRVNFSKGFALYVNKGVDNIPAGLFYQEKNGKTIYCKNFTSKARGAIKNADKIKVINDFSK